MSIEAMKQALEALEYVYEGANNQGPHTGISWRCVSNKTEPAITSLRQAIAEAEKQEPVIDKSAAARIATALGWEPKREWVGLTDEEIDQGLCHTPYAMKTAEDWREGVRWAYHQLNEKNT